MKNKNENVTVRLKNLVKKKNMTTVVYKAGSVKRNSRSRQSGSFDDYYPSYSKN